MGRNLLNNKFFNDKKNNKDFYSILDEVQEHMSRTYTKALDDREEMIPYIRKYINDNSLYTEEISEDELIDKLISEMAGFGCYDKYLYKKIINNKYIVRDDVEEINSNHWKSIIVKYKNGKKEHVKNCFKSPEHAENIVKRMLRKCSDIVFDNANPIVRGHLDGNIRITAVGMGITDKDKGVAVSIRIVNPEHMSEKEYIEKGTASEEMFYAIKTFYKYGMSICIAGPTGSGKTTTASLIVENTIEDNNRLITIEEDVREFDFVKYDRDAIPKNEVIHLVTKHSHDSNKDIDQDKLIELSLTMNPDYLIVSEMKGKEADSAKKAANIGIPILSTTHSNSATDTYPRLVDLCKEKSKMDYDTLLRGVIKAFPIVIFQKKLKDSLNSKRVMEIKETTIDFEGNIRENILFEFNEIEDLVIDGERYINGEFKKLNNISEQSQNILKLNNIPKKELDRLLNWKDGDKYD
ncbi:TPA: ATPase, T2SS/T4P/T4SS family [Clostridioides difficile]|uniref:ATPase, T2SS/T4P/T4SS family n=1 Tax=Clostridioides difficile TaxID=1496 RepID=UPI0009766C2A|nr:ATPase, T2SS/T4P/T4SS family [Clostridioides difficile]MBS1300571.1 type II secretion system protein E [Clostridioides difficile]MBY1695096.1 Flp pilus assembly complex ATPase component TadA [Clostridioides difficile]MBY2557822.1 Flp pilus assembly complex ATPase component TadA [Clostridioides difficile]MCG3626775.1 Flp pilus assembly complex ATPase component TadA [Clostridioides difficile]MCO4709868.1 Flp pilus assembly complex ATPase component TadA [Clostridioides difficile]